jgi:hypothetical protein
MDDPLWTILSILLILFIGSVILVREQTKGTDYKSNAATRKYDNIDSISVLHAIQEGQIDSLIQEIKAAEKRPETDDPEKAIARGLVWWTFVLAWATIVGAVVAGFTLNAIRAQRTEMQIARESSDNAMAAQLRIMAGQLNQMDIGQRPWVRLTVAKPQYLLVGETDIIIGLEFHARNVGHSPAEGVYATGKVFPNLSFDRTKHGCACGMRGFPCDIRG